MASPQSATQFQRPHRYEDRTYENYTPRFSPPSNYNSSYYSNAYTTVRKPTGSYAYNKYSKVECNTDSNWNQSWNEGENSQPDRYFDVTPIANNCFPSHPASSFEKQDFPSRFTKFEHLRRNRTDQDCNPLTERNKWSELSRSRLHEADSSSSYNQVHQQASNSRIEVERHQRQNHLRESQSSDHDQSYIYDSNYGYVRKVDCTEIVSEKDSSRTSKIYKRTDSLTCLICSEEVKRRDIKGHLLFGYVQCLSCPWNTKNCKDFSERHKSRFQCSHCKLQWEFLTVDQICNNPVSKNKKFLKTYLAKTIALKYYAPHDIGYNHFQTIVDEMLDKECEEMPAVVESDSKQNKCRDPASDAGIDREVDINGNVAVPCNNSDESTNTLLQNLEELVTFNQSPLPHVLQDDSAREEIKFEFVTSKEIVSDTLSKICAKKEYFESYSNSRMPKNNKNKSKIVSIKDKHKTLIIGAPNDDVNETKNNAVTPKKKEKNESRSKDHDILPSFVSDNYVLTYTLSDDCPQCYASLNPLEFTVCMKSHIVVAKCGECSLFICFRNKLIESYKSSLRRQ